MLSTIKESFVVDLWTFHTTSGHSRLRPRRHLKHLLELSYFTVFSLVSSLG